MSPNTLNSIGPVRIEPSILRLISPYAISASVIASMAVTSTVSGASPSISQVQCKGLFPRKYFGYSRASFPLEVSTVLSADPILGLQLGTLFALGSRILMGNGWIAPEKRLGDTGL